MIERFFINMNILPELDNIILSKTSNGALFKALRLTCKTYHDYFDAKYYEWVDRFCNHHSSMFRAGFIDVAIDFSKVSINDLSDLDTYHLTEMKNLTIETYIKIRGNHDISLHDRLTLARNPSFAYEHIIEYPKMFGFNSFACNPNCTVDIFYDKILPKMRNDNICKDTTLQQLYGRDTLFKVMKESNHYVSMIELLLRHEKTRWTFVDRFKELLGNNIGVNLFGDDVPTKVIDDLSDVDWNIDKVMTYARMTDDLFDRYKDQYADCISLNSTITIDFIRRHIAWGWDWFSLAISRPSISDIISNPDLPWHPHAVASRHDINVPILKTLKEHETFPPHVWDVISSNCQLTSADFFANLNLPWSYEMLLNNKTVTYPIAQHVYKSLMME